MILHVPILSITYFFIKVLFLCQFGTTSPSWSNILGLLQKEPVQRKIKAMIDKFHESRAAGQYDYPAMNEFEIIGNNSGSEEQKPEVISASSFNYFQPRQEEYQFWRSIISDNQLTQIFELWAKGAEKSYASEEEKHQRFSIFQYNFISLINALYDQKNFHALQSILVNHSFAPWLNRHLDMNYLEFQNSYNYQL